MFGLHKRIRRWLYKRRIEHTIQVLLLIDKTMQVKGFYRPARRSLRIIKRELENNKEALIDLLNDVSIKLKE